MPKIIGITGSIGMGKSTIASMLSQIRIPVFDSDKEVAKILKENSKVINEYWIKMAQSYHKRKQCNKY